MALATVPASSSTHGRDRILVQASELFLSRGYAETSLRTIAEAVGMQPASIYHHFPSKDALLTEILDIGMAAVNEAFDRAAHSTGFADTGEQRLARHVRAHLEALFAHHSFTAAHVTIFPFVPEPVRRAAVSDRDAYERRWSDLLVQIVPSLDSAAVQLARLSMISAMNATIQWFDPDQGDLAALGAGMATLFWNGIDPGEPR